MSLFKKEPEANLEETPTKNHYTSTTKPNHPSLSWKQVSTVKPDHLDNYVEVHPFARAEATAPPRFKEIMKSAMKGSSKRDIARVVKFISSSQFNRYWSYLDGRSDKSLNIFASLILEYLDSDEMFLEDLVENLVEAGLY
mgnify:CR=1 FL=1